MSHPARTGEFELSGGVLCLDFANTLDDRPRSENEHLASYADLLRFTRQAGALPVPDLDRLDRLARTSGSRVEPIFQGAIELREVVYRVFSGLGRDESPAEADLRVLNRALNRGLKQLELQRAEEGYDWIWGGPERALDRPLWPLARSAAELLTSPEVRRVRECDSETCSWLFVDRSRNHRRRWCDMATCGNRAKVRRHYQRRKETS